MIGLQTAILRATVHYLSFYLEMDLYSKPEKRDSSTSNVKMTTDIKCHTKAPVLILFLGSF